MLLLIASSCATEKLNSSPITGNFYTESKNVETKDFSININDNVSASEITNLISTFPTFKNLALNEEINSLKYTLQNYLYAVDAGNVAGKNRNFSGVEKSYKKIQKLRKNLGVDDNELLNRYLVKIKTNITLIEDSYNAKKNNK